MSDEIEANQHAAGSWSRRRWLRSCLGYAAGLAAAPGVYAFGIEPHWWEKVARPLPIEHLPDALQGKMLVQISDIHVGRFVSHAYLHDVFREISSWNPDFVVYTGDFITLSKTTQAQFLDMLPHFPKGSRATVASFGNHDYGYKWMEKRWANWLKTHLATRGIRALINEIEVVDGLQIIGMGETMANEFLPEIAFASWRRDQAALVLSHNPDTIEERDWCGYRGWVLAGHTHGGQCRLPGCAPPILPVRNVKFVAGHYPLADGRNLYVNRGIGHSLPVRFAVRPEVTVFTLLRA